MTTKYPKTVAAVQKRDRSLWEIGDALLEETDVGGSYDELADVVGELEHLKIEGYSVEYLAKLRITADKFPPSRRSATISWRAHINAGSPDMLDTIVKTAGNKPVTADRVKAVRKTIEEQQAREYRAEHPGKPVPKRSNLPMPTQKEVKGLALMAEVSGWVSRLSHAISEIEAVDRELTDAKVAKINPDDAEFLVDRSNRALNLARGLVEKIKPLRASKPKLSVVGE